MTDTTTMKFEELHQQLAINARPDFGFITDPDVPKGVLTINQSQHAVVHPDDKQQLMDVVSSAGWKPIDQT